MNLDKSYKYLVGAAIVFILLASSVFVVDQRQQALILQFGEAIKVIKTPGLKFKTPFVQNVILLDNRILDLGISDQEVISSDQKRLIINAYTKYKIVDPLKFYTTVRTQASSENKLSAILDSSLRKIVGGFPMVKLLSEERNLIMSKIQESVSEETKIFGIEIVDVRIVRGDLPKENSEAIFTRMQTEREKEAKEIRAKGGEEAEMIKAQADKEKTVLLAEANKKSNIIRGNGDGEAARIFASAALRDPEFFDFYLSMQAYKSALKGDNTTMVISPNSEFFKYFGNLKRLEN